MLARPGFLLTLALLLPRPALAQEGQENPTQENPTQEDTPQEDPDDPDLTLPMQELQGQQQEMIRLFHEVQETLESIDVELYDASAGRLPAPEGRDSGIDRLMRSHGEKSDQAVSGIERILELAQQMGGSKGGT